MNEHGLYAAISAVQNRFEEQVAEMKYALTAELCALHQSYLERQKVQNADRQREVDENAIGELTVRMKEKLAKKRAQGFGNTWKDKTEQELSDMLWQHVAKGIRWMLLTSAPSYAQEASASPLWANNTRSWVK